MRQADEEFRRKLEEQKREHEQKLKELREKRAEIEVVVTGNIRTCRKLTERSG